MLVTKAWTLLYSVFFLINGSSFGLMSLLMPQVNHTGDKQRERGDSLMGELKVQSRNLGNGYSFRASMLLVGCQEGHLACRKISPASLV